MNTISTKSVNEKKGVYWFFFVAACTFLAGITIDLFFLGFTVVFGIIGLFIFRLANETVMLSHDVEGKLILVSTYEKQMEFPLDQVLNLTEGGTYGKHTSTTSYYLTVKDNDVFGKNIKFTIDREDIGCMDNYGILRGEIIKIRSKRAKEWAYGKKSN